MCRKNPEMERGQRWSGQTLGENGIRPTSHSALQKIMSLSPNVRQENRITKKIKREGRLTDKNWTQRASAVKDLNLWTLFQFSTKDNRPWSRFAQNVDIPYIFIMYFGSNIPERNTEKVFIKKHQSSWRSYRNHRLEIWNGRLFDWKR